MSSLKPYTSGYMKPPAHSRFKPGKSGNPKGRPKQPATPYTALWKAMKRKVTVKGEDRKIRLDEALIRRLRGLAHSGDGRAITLLLKFTEIAGVGLSAIRTVPDVAAAKRRFIEMAGWVEDDPNVISQEEDGDD